MKKIIIDTDCGIDDAIAIIMALQTKDIKVIGISTVNGNVSIEKATRNVLRLLHFMGREEIPVYKGASAPLIQKLIRAEGVHGEDGLGNVSLPLGSKMEESVSAPQGLKDLLIKEDNIDIITLGPLTNLAITFNLFPEVKKKVKSIVAMGGAIERGNVTKFAEFNFFADPESAQYLLNLDIPFLIVPWDPIVKIPFSKKEVNEIAAGKGRLGNLFLELAATPIRFVHKFYGLEKLTLPDPIAMAAYLYPEVIKGKIIAGLEMELNYTTMRGMSVLKEGERLEIVTEIDRDLFRNILEKSLKSKKIS